MLLYHSWDKYEKAFGIVGSPNWGLYHEMAIIYQMKTKSVLPMTLQLQRLFFLRYFPLKSSVYLSEILSQIFALPYFLL